MDLNKGISTPIAILLIIAVSAVVGVLVWQKTNIKEVNLSDINIFHQKEKPVKLDDGKATEEGKKKLVKANNEFAFNFYSNIKEKEQGKNVFFSPYSISTAVAMTYEGAKNKTASQIQSVFSFSQDDTERRSSMAAIYNGLNEKDKKYELNTANALWVQENYELLDEYKKTIKNYYGGKATNVDFKGNTEQARKTINSWVEDKTQNKIKNLFPKGSLNRLSRLVLTNAIYFKGDWKTQFKESRTKKEDFKVNEEKTVKAPMMRRTDDEAEYNYGETEKAKLLEMTYKGEDLSMLVALPKEGDLSSVEGTLDMEKWKEWRSSLSEERVDVYVPKFTFDSKYNLNENLKEMGMPLAFTKPSKNSGANFSGISGKRDLFIQKVIHQAFVEVNEEGTEAAAATGISMGATSAGPQKVKIFRADHPFLFFIQDKETGNILFMGRVVDPTI